MIRVTMNNVTAQAQGDDKSLDWLDRLLSFPNTAARFSGGQERIRVMDPRTGVFPAGFTRVVYDKAQREGVDIQIMDTRVRPHVDPGADLAWLRDYQRDAVAAALRRTRGYVHAPTASGKTEVAAGIIRSLPHARVAFLVHRTQLADQTAKRFNLRIPEVSVGIVGDGRWEPCAVTVATFQTLWASLRTKEPRAVKFLESLDALIVDECHTLPARTFSAVLDACTNAYFRVGLSGTPVAGGGEKAIAVTGRLGPVVYRITPDVLIAAGLVARPTVRMVSVHQKYELKPAIGRYAQMQAWKKVQSALIVNSRVRNDAICRVAHASEKPCMVFVQSLKHGANLAKTLRHGGLKVEFVEGRLTLEARNAAVKRLERGDSDVLVATVVFNEGVDIPCLRSVVVASGGKSPVAAIQRVGRGMRISEGKSTFDVWDLADEGVPMLERHTKERVKSYKGEGYAVEGAPIAFTK